MSAAVAAPFAVRDAAVVCADGADRARAVRVDRDVATTVVRVVRATNGASIGASGTRVEVRGAAAGDRVLGAARNVERTAA
jgi:hypothetical protein